MLVILAALGFAALLSLPVMMGLRRLAMDVSHYRGNPRFRMIADAAATVGGALAVAMLFVVLLDRIGVLWWLHLLFLTRLLG